MCSQGTTLNNIRNTHARAHAHVHAHTHSHAHAHAHAHTYTYTYHAAIQIHIRDTCTALSLFSTCLNIIAKTHTQHNKFMSACSHSSTQNTQYTCKEEIPAVRFLVSQPVWISSPASPLRSWWSAARPLNECEGINTKKLLNLHYATCASASVCMGERSLISAPFLSSFNIHGC